MSKAIGIIVFHGFKQGFNGFGRGATFLCGGEAKAGVEVKSGLECGIKIAGYDDIKIDDEFEAYEIEEIARTL